MIEPTANIPRYQYLIRSNDLKTNNQPLNNTDYLNIGYMAGRFGINLSNPNEANYMCTDNRGTFVNINSCTASLFEDNLNKMGIRFNRIA